MTPPPEKYYLCLPFHSYHRRRDKNKNTIADLICKAYLAFPGAQQTNTDIAILIQIWIESVGAVGYVVEQWWTLGVLRW